MAWLESHQSLKEHVKTKRLCRNLGIERVQAVGHLHLLWWWALDNAIDGFIAEKDFEFAAEAADWPCNAMRNVTRNAGVFFDALVEAEFAEKTDGGILIHDWDDYTGRYSDQREKNRERQRNYRARRAAEKSDKADKPTNALRNVTVTGLPDQPDQPTNMTNQPTNPHHAQSKTAAHKSVASVGAATPVVSSPSFSGSSRNGWTNGPRAPVNKNITTSEPYPSDWKAGDEWTPEQEEAWKEEQRQKAREALARRRKPTAAEERAAMLASIKGA